MKNAAVGKDDLALRVEEDEHLGHSAKELLQQVLATKVGDIGRKLVS